MSNAEKGALTVMFAVVVGLSVITHLKMNELTKVKQFDQSAPDVLKLVEEQQRKASEQHLDTLRLLQKIEEKLEELKPRNVYPGSPAPGLAPGASQL